MSSLSQHKPFYISPSVTIGPSSISPNSLGVIATRDIKAGELIMIDSNPIMVVPPSSSSSSSSSSSRDNDYAMRFVSSSQSEREAWLSLWPGSSTPDSLRSSESAAMHAISNSSSSDELPTMSSISLAVSVARANAFEGGMLYTNGLSRFNHSCDPSCLYYDDHGNNNGD